MKKILLSFRGMMTLAFIAIVVLAYVAVARSTGNTFALGEVDVMIGNDSYYNGQPSPNTSWSVRDLTIEKFFNFQDVKPGDYGEDTIEIGVELEDTYLCANVTLTSNNDNGCNEPEGNEDASCGNPGLAEGELADLVEFMWWSDDGDNVFESDEAVISAGPIGNLTLGSTTIVALADTATNIWTNVPGPVLEGSTQYIGKAWCYGELTPTPLTQDGFGNVRSPSLDNDGVGGAGTPTDGGFDCLGAGLGNESQTDSLTVDVAFNAVQVTGNSGYRCSDGEPNPNQNEPESIFNDSFGIGGTDTTFNEAPTWIEGGAGAEKRSPVGVGEEASPNGSRKAAMRAPGGYICRSIDASTYSSLKLAYFWRGDANADLGDTGIVEYATGGTCAAPTGLTMLQTHDLTTNSWQLQNDFALPASLDHSVFFLRFRNAANTAGEDFRADGVNLVGIPD